MRYRCGGVLRERAREHAVELLRQVLALRPDGRHLGVHVRCRLGSRRVASERPPTREQLPRDDGERIAIASRCRPLALRLLGREVRGGADHRPGLRQGVHPGGARDPEVRDVHVVGSVQEQVRGLHVAVDDAFRVRGVERNRGLLEPVERLTGVDPAAADAVLERAASEVLHDDERAAFRLADVEDRDDVRTPGEPGRCERLAGEALADTRVLRVALGEDLDGDDAAQQLVGRAVDLAHTARADLLGVAVAIGEVHGRSIAVRGRRKTLLPGER